MNGDKFEGFVTETLVSILNQFDGITYTSSSCDNGQLFYSGVGKGREC